MTTLAPIPKTMIQVAMTPRTMWRDRGIVSKSSNWSTVQKVGLIVDEPFSSDDSFTSKGNCSMNWLCSQEPLLLFPLSSIINIKDGGKRMSSTTPNIGLAPSSWSSISHNFRSCTDERYSILHYYSAFFMYKYKKKSSEFFES